MKVSLNGENVLLDQAEFEKIFDEKNIVIIVNGYQVDSPVKIKDFDIIHVIRKGELPNEQVLETMMAARHTPGVHSKVKGAKVAIAGLGGLGSNIAANLARVGVGYLKLIDFDVVEPSNLNRQNYYVKHLGMKKTDATKSILEDINPFVTVDVVDVKVEKDNIVELFGDVDIIVEAFDKAEYKALLINEALDKLSDKYIVAASGMAGYFSANEIKTVRKFKRLYVCGDGINGAKFGSGLMAPRVSVCAGHQANQVLRIILEEYDV